MNSKLGKTIWVIVVASMVGLCLFASEARATIVYSDDFATDYDGWTYMDVSDGQECKWEIVTGVLQEKSNAADGVFISGYSSDSTDYTITVKARSAGTADSGMGIVFGYTDAQNYWQFVWRPSSGNRELSQFVNGTKNVWASDIESVTTSTWYTMEVDVAGGTVTCKIDTVTKLTYSATPALNYNGLYTYDNDNGIQYDDYSIDETGTSGDGPSKASDGNYYISEYWQYVDSLSTTYATLKTLQFTPGSINEHWVVVVTWRTKDTTAEDATTRKVGRARILVNGATRTGLDAIGGEHFSSNWQAFGTFFQITGTTAQQTIELQYAADDNTDRWDRARIMAFKIPNPNEADIQYFEDLGPDTNLVQTDYDFTFTPSSDGDYIIMGSATGHEGPGGARSATLMQFIDHAAVIQSEADESWFGSTEPYVSLFHVQKSNLTATSKTFKIRHNPDLTNGSDIRHVVMLAFRADVFNNAQYALATTNATTTLTSWQNYLTLSPAGTTTPRDNVYLAAFHRNPDASGYHDICRITFDYSTYIQDSITNRGGQDAEMVMGYADTSTGDKRITLDYKTATGESADAQGGYIVTLSYPSGNTAESPYCESAATPVTNVTDLTPEFSAIYNDAGTSMTATYYEIEVDTKSTFDGKRMWDTGKTALAVALADNTRSTDVSYAGTALTLNGITYYWRIRFWDDSGGLGLWSATQQFTMQCTTGQYTYEWGENSNCEFKGTSSDTYLDQGQNNYNMGTATLVRIGDGTGSRANRTMVKFDFSNIPISESSQIVSATVNYKTYDNGVVGDIIVDAFPVKKQWNEGLQGYGVPDTTENAPTWGYQYYNSTLWETVGCDGPLDRETTSDGTQTFAAVTTWYSWAVANTVKTMFTNSQYYGWILKCQSEGTAARWRIYSNNNKTAANRPYLSITYNASNPPLAPQTPYCEGAVTPVSSVTDSTPEFSAIYDDANTLDTAEYYEIEVNTLSDFSGTVMWDTDKTVMASLAENVRSTDVSYAGTALTDGTYYWRIRFWDNTGARGTWSATQEFTYVSDAIAPTIDSYGVSETSSYIYYDSGTATVWYGDGMSVNESFTLTGTASDNVGGTGLQKATFTASAALGSPVDDTTAADWAGLYDTVSSDDIWTGVLTVTLYDNVNNTATQDYTVSRDTVPPAPSAVAFAEDPASDAVYIDYDDVNDIYTIYYSGDGTSYVTASYATQPTDADSGIEKVAFPDVFVVTANGVDTTAPYSITYTIDSTATNEGGAPGWSTVVYDNVGHNAASTNVIYIDKEVLPPLSIDQIKTISGGTDIAQSTWQGDNDPYFAWSSTSDIVDYYTIEVSGATTIAAINKGTVATHQFTDNQLNNGKNNITVRVYNKVGRSNSVTSYVWVCGDGSDIAITYQGSTPTESVWYQGTGEQFSFTSTQLDNNEVGYYKYIIDTSSDGSNLDTDPSASPDQWPSGTLSLNIPNSKYVYIHLKPYPDSGDDTGFAPIHKGPYQYVETSRLLRGGKFFDNNGTLIEHGPKSQ